MSVRSGKTAAMLETLSRYLGREVTRAELDEVAARETGGEICNGTRSVFVVGVARPASSGPHQLMPPSFGLLRYEYEEKDKP